MPFPGKPPQALQHDAASAIHELLDAEARPALLARIAEAVSPPPGLAARISALLVESPPLTAVSRVPALMRLSWRGDVLRGTQANLMH